MKQIILFFGRVKWLSQLLAVIILTMSCTDNDTFSTDRNNRLTFTQEGAVIDTLDIDTVFTQVGSSTHTFIVNNNSSDGIRLTNVILRGGNQYGFRVNVDGTYLSKENGYQMNDLEIRKGDSVRVFVEVLAPKHSGIPYAELTDQLVFNLESGVSQSLTLHACSMDAKEMRGKVVTADETLDGSTPLIIYDSLVVAEGATLTIPAGTTLYFHDKAGIDVRGTLRVEGTPEANVTMRGDRLDHMFDYLPYDGVSGQWEGIHIRQSSYNNIITHADIHGAYNAIVCDSSDVSKLKLDIRNSIVHNNKGYGLWLTHSSVSIVNCQITNALYNCLYVCGGNYYINNCTIAQYYVINKAGDYACHFTNTHDGHHYPLYRFDVYNSIITGMSDDAILGNGDTLSTYNYYLDHCLIKTPAFQSDKIKDIIFDKDTLEWTSDKNFRLIDHDNLRYDFRLDTLSIALGKADATTSEPTDLHGRPRKSTPDLGCYEEQ